MRLSGRAFFERVGAFDADRRYGEDLDFFRRAEKGGARFAIAPKAVIHHVTPGSG